MVLVELKSQKTGRYRKYTFATISAAYPLIRKELGSQTSTACRINGRDVFGIDAKGVIYKDSPRKFESENQGNFNGIKSRELRTDQKDTKRKLTQKFKNKSEILDMVEALIANGRVKNGICRHNHNISVASTGKIYVDGEPDSDGYIDSDYVNAAKKLISKEYFIKYVRNSPVIHDPDGNPTLITVCDLTRRR